MQVIVSHYKNSGFYLGNVEPLESFEQGNDNLIYLLRILFWCFAEIELWQGKNKGTETCQEAIAVIHVRIDAAGVEVVMYMQVYPGSGLISEQYQQYFLTVWRK